MRIYLEDDERILLTINELTILIALSNRPASSYGLARTCSSYLQLSQPISTGSIRPALKRLELFQLVRRIESTEPHPNPGKPKIIYQLSSTGKLILQWQLDSLRHLIALTQA